MVIKAVEFPNRTFDSKEALFKELKKSEERLIQIKKGCVYKSVNKGSLSGFNSGQIKTSTNKGVFNFETKSDHIYPIISTTNWLDSHRDVHFKGCFDKTVKDQQGKVVYALDHVVSFDTVLAWKENVEMYVSELPWSVVGKNIDGNTEGLVLSISKDKIRRKDVLSEIESKSSDFENSISMVYHKIFLAMDSNDSDYRENKAYYDEKVDLIANKDELGDLGYFWGVEELGIHKEGSLVSAGGSNSATSIYQDTEPSGDTQNEPLDDTRKSNIKMYL